MDLRQIKDGLNPKERCDERRAIVEKELKADLGMLEPKGEAIGSADEKNCEQMVGHMPLPVGIAGPLKIRFSDGTLQKAYLPLATTEGALVASVNRGCKALSQKEVVITTSIHHGTSRSIAWKNPNVGVLIHYLNEHEQTWIDAGQKTSSHLRIIKSEKEEKGGHVFLTVFCHTDEAMGMNMVTIAADAIGRFIAEKVPGTEFITVAANVDSDKKPSSRVHDHGRGYEVKAEAIITGETLKEVLKCSADAALSVAHAKLELGSELAGAISRNLHASNIVAALYIATGQDAAHVVEGSLADTSVGKEEDGIRITVRLPAIMVGVRGGGTTLPAQSQCLQLLLGEKTGISRRRQLAESVAAAVLSGELSLLAAQAAHHLVKAHKKLGR